jgi:hypothetical protein
MRESDFEYFHRRAAEERHAADCADHSLARRAHLDLARRYEEMAEATKPPPTTVHMPAEVVEMEATPPLSRSG